MKKLLVILLCAVIPVVGYVDNSYKVKYDGGQ
jgi:hypothetical protein